MQEEYIVIFDFLEISGSESGAFELVQDKCIVIFCFLEISGSESGA